MSIEPHLPRDHAFGPEDVEILSSALEETLCSLRLIDRIDPAVSMVAERLIQLAGARSGTRVLLPTGWRVRAQSPLWQRTQQALTAPPHRSRARMRLGTAGPSRRSRTPQQEGQDSLPVYSTRQTSDPRLFGDTLTDQGPFHIRRRAAETIARTAGISRTRNTTSEELSNQCLNGIDDRPSNQAEYDYNKSHHAPDEARMYQVHTR